MAANVRWVTSDDVSDQVVHNWLAMYERYKSSELIANVVTEVKCITVDNKWFFPVTINNAEWGNSYVSYAQEELKRKITNRWVIAALTPVIKGLGLALKWSSMNKVVHVNNFIFSTNPYPDWDGYGLQEIRRFISAQFPNHMIIFRSLNELQHPGLLNAIGHTGFKCVVSRQVYMYQPDREQWQKHNNNYQDARIIRKSGLSHIGHEQMEDHLKDALHLYNLLYLEKYSLHNPQFTLKFFEECHRRHLIHFQGYIDREGHLKAFSGIFVYSGTITSPLVGYDTSALAKDGLYVHAIKTIFDHLFSTGQVLNLSSGASLFKRLRGGRPVIEYSCISCAHLPLQTRAMVRMLAFVSNSIGKPLLMKYEL
jgi:hypothetical protein